MFLKARIKNIAYEDIYLIKLVSILDCGVLLLYSILVLQGILRDSNLLSSKIIIDNGILTVVLLFSGLTKVFLYFDADEEKALKALGLMSVIVVGKAVGYNDYMTLGALILAAYNMDFTKLAKVHVAVTFVTLGIIFILSLFGLVESVEYNEPSRVVRSFGSLGFANHNYFMLFWLFALLALLFLVYGKRLQLLYYVFLIMITIFLWKLTGCNTVVIIGGFACLLSLLYSILSRCNNVSIGKTIREKMSLLLVGMPFYGAVFTMIGLYLVGRYGYGEKLFSLWDRFGLLYRALERLGCYVPFNMIDESDRITDISFSLLNGIGRNEYPGPEYFDILYGKLFILDGLIAVLIYILICFGIMYKAYRLKQFNILIFMASYVFLGFVEATAISKVPGYIGLMFLFSMQLDYKNKNRVKNNAHLFMKSRGRINAQKIKRNRNSNI